MTIEPIKTPSAQSEPKVVTILGSTGTIGKNTIKLIEDDRDSFVIEALTANESVELLAEQAKRLGAKAAVIKNEKLYDDLKSALAGTDIEAMAGSDAVNDAAARNANIVMAGIVGSASLAPTLAAIKNGTTIGLANKECLVCLGDLMTNEVMKHGATLVPVDSEHNAVF